jgi:hypothetical protein
MLCSVEWCNDFEIEQSVTDRGSYVPETNDVWQTGRPYGTSKIRGSTAAVCDNRSLGSVHSLKKPLHN